jgi:hypothetical protein
LFKNKKKAANFLVYLNGSEIIDMYHNVQEIIFVNLQKQIIFFEGIFTEIKLENDY